MDDKPIATIEQNPGFADRDHLPQRRKWATFLGFSVLFALLVVIAVFVIIMYSQVKTLARQNKDAYNTVVTNVVYHIEGTEEIVNEHIVVNDREEDITTPKARMIFDYENDLVVTKIISDDESEDVCFVAKFDHSEGIDEVREAVRNEQNEKMKSDVSLPFSDTEEEYESTDVSVDIETLSPRAREMCAGHKILMTKKMDGNELEGQTADREKRTSYFWSCTVFCNPFGWRCLQNCYRRGAHY